MAIVPATSTQTTRVRYRVLLFCFFGSIVTYLDRVCISVAAPAISRDLGLTNMQMGYVFSVFALSYAIFEIPAGWWGDRVGQRRVMTRIVAGWSAFTILTGVSWNYVSLLTTRFAFGAAEAGAFPTMARMLGRWFPQYERARANGVMWMGARVGGAISPAIAVMLIARVGWRATFGILGIVGLFWAVAFRVWYRDDPCEHPSVSASELAHIRAGRVETNQAGHGRTPWRRMASSKTLWAMFGMYFCPAYGFWFFVTWLPTFLIKDHGLDLHRSGFYAMLPLAFGTVSCPLGGLLADWLARRTGNLKWSRRAIGMGGFILAAAGFGLASIARDPLAAVLLLACAEGASDLTLSVTWATVVDVGGRFGGTTGAFVNMASSFSAMISSVAAPWLAETFGSFNAMLATAAAVYLTGATLWLAIDPTRAVSD